MHRPLPVLFLITVSLVALAAAHLHARSPIATPTNPPQKIHVTGRVAHPVRHKLKAPAAFVLMFGFQGRLSPQGMEIKCVAWHRDGYCDDPYCREERGQCACFTYGGVRMGRVEGLG